MAAASRWGWVRALFDDIPLKLVSLVIALSLFAVVRSERDATTAVTVKVVYALPTDRVLVSEPVAELRVGVRGPWTRLARLDERALKPVRVDLRDASDGVFHFDDSMVKLPSGFKVGSITPPEVALRFEPRRARELPIEPVVEGQAADGFRVTHVEVMPKRVRVEGAESALRTLSRVRTRPVAVAGLRENRVFAAALEEETPHAQALLSQVSVRIEVERALVEQRLDAVAVRPQGLSRYEGRVEPARVAVILRGPEDAIAAARSSGVAVHVDGQYADTRPPGRSVARVVVSGLPHGVAAEVEPEQVLLVTHRRH